jgi:hypothetical protein
MSKYRFKQNRLQFLIPLLVVLFILPGNLIAKTSTRLVIKKTGQETLEGILLSVDTKEKSLVVQVDNTGVKIPLDEIDTLWFHREFSPRRRIGTSILVGAALGASVGFVTYSRESDYPRRYLVTFFAVAFGLLGLIEGLSKGSSGRTPKRIQVKGSSPAEITKILKKLKKKARIK